MFSFGQNKKFLILLGTILFLLIGIIMISSHKSTIIRFPDGTRITAEIVDTPASQAKGLSGRTGLEKDHGMLFVFPESQEAGIWMKDMKFPIDILWLEEGIIRHIEENAPILDQEGSISRFLPDVMADQVLELPAGTVKEHGLVLGDKLTIK